MDWHIQNLQRLKQSIEMIDAERIFFFDWDVIEANLCWF